MVDLKTTLLSSEADRIALSNDLLEGIVRNIVDAMPTDSIYIFGSYARGEQTPKSDVDIYAISSDPSRSTSELSFEARKAIFPLMEESGLQFDIIGASRESFDNNVRKFGYVEYFVNEEGVKIYG